MVVDSLDGSQFTDCAWARNMEVEARDTVLSMVKSDDKYHIAVFVPSCEWSVISKS